MYKNFSSKTCVSIQINQKIRSKFNTNQNFQYCCCPTVTFLLFVYLNSIRSQAGSWAALNKWVKVLVHVFKDQVEDHLTLQPLTVADIQQSEQGGTGTSLQYTD